MSEESKVEVTVTNPEPEPNPEPNPPAKEEPSPSLEMLVGEMKSKLEQLTTDMQTLSQKVEGMQTEDRWTEERLTDLWNSLYRLENQVEEMEAEEETQEEAEEVTEAIPAIPEPVEQVEQGEPKQDKKFWSLKNWM